MAQNATDNLPNKQAVYDLIKRVVPKHADQFTVGFIAKDDDKDVFFLMEAPTVQVLE